jgi:ABC-2 type transport system ATP-binding protein
MTPPTTAAATVRDVTMRFRGHTALDGVSTVIERDSITGLLGRNGAGKTTLMQLLTGHRVPTSGSVEVLGGAPYENEGVLPGICFVKEGQRYPDHFRVRDALDAAALVYPGWDADLAAELLRDFDLPPKRPVKKLSRGMTSAVGIVIGLASRAPITLFDEPYLGLDAVARQLFYDRLLADYAEHPRTVVLSTHLIEEIAALLERVLLIDRGRVLLDADAESLRGSAVTVTGPSDRVAAFAGRHELLHTESLAGQSRSVVRLTGGSDGGDAADAGLAWEPVTLQQLVVAMSLRTPRPESSTRTDLEEVPR